MEFVRKVAGVRVYELDTPQGARGIDSYNHRRPYIYLPRHDIFLWGSPGSFHYDVREAGQDLLQGVNPGKYMSYDFGPTEAVYGSYFTNPKGAAAHSVWDYTGLWSHQPQVLDRLNQVVGIPVNPNVHAEAYLEEVGDDNWELPAITSSSGVDPNPPDQWWMIGCPNCDHSELEIHFHGGVSCPMCGWEGEMTQSGQLLGIMPPTEEDADALWPDYLPWGEAEQNYYRNARIAAWLPKSHITRLAGFYVWTADIHEKAQQVRAELLTREDVAKWVAKKDEEENRGNDGRPVTTLTLVKGFLSQIPDEGFKLFPWWIREMKKGLFDNQQWSHALDIAMQAAQWAEWSREHNKPMPDYMKKDFGFQEMQDWVYEMNSKEVVDGAGWTDSKTVHKWTDGWHMDQVGADDLAKEGELMGHCVGGYCQQVRQERSTIYSLRDPKGHPHVTIEVSGPPLATNKGEGDGHGIEVVQVQGKQDTEPIPEYRERVQEWYDHLQEEIGYNYVDEQDPDREPDYEWIDHEDGPYNIEDIDDVMDYWDLATDGRDWNYAFGRDEEGEWEDNTIYYQNPRELVVEKTLFQLLEQMADNVDEYDEDEIISYVQGVWLIMQHLGNARRYHGGIVYNPKGEWEQLASQFSDYVDEYYVIKPKDAPQGQERMFSNEPWLVDKLPPKVEFMKDYVLQIAGMEDHEKYEVTQQRRVYPEDWEDQKTQLRQQLTEAQERDRQQIQQPGYVIPYQNFYQQIREMEQALPMEDYQAQRRYTFPNYDDYLNTDWKQIWNRDEWQYKPPMLQAEATWTTDDDIATKALGMLHQNYGFSLDPLGQPIEPGFYVSYQGHTRIISLNSITSLDIENYMRDHAEVLSRTPDSFFGGWIEDDGNVYLDVSRSFQIPEMAMEFGRTNHQDAIYDGFNRQTVPVDYTEKASEWLSDGS